MPLPGLASCNGAKSHLYVSRIMRLKASDAWSWLWPASLLWCTSRLRRPSFTSSTMDFQASTEVTWSFNRDIESESGARKISRFCFCRGWSPRVFKIVVAESIAVACAEREKVEVAHVKLAASRAFVMVAYYTQSHEMLFDAHARAFEIFGGIPKRGIYDNMKTAVDKVGAGKQRSVNARFESMTGHYLFEPEFCNRAAGWEKGIVEKNVQDRRRGIWREVSERRWANLDELNVWVRQACLKAWQEMKHPEWPELTVADVWQDEQVRLMPCPTAFNGYIEQPVLVSPTSLIHYQRNRYSVPCEWINSTVSLRVYPAHLLVVAADGECVTLKRSFERDQTIYDWTHYISLIERKPGALRNGAPFKGMPEPLLELQRQLLKNPGGDRVMAKVLNAVTLHGLEPVLVAVELALQAGRVSGEHVLNILSRLQEPTKQVQELPMVIELIEPSQADVHRYDALRLNKGDDHVA